MPAPPEPGPVLVVEFVDEVEFALELAAVVADEVVVELEEPLVVVEYSHPPDTTLTAPQ